MSDEIKPCPDCRGECVRRENILGSGDLLGGVICSEGCGHIVAAESADLAIKKHNAIPRWHSYSETPSDAGVKWVASHTGFVQAVYNKNAGWVTTLGVPIRILKWTDMPVDLPCRH